MSLLLNPFRRLQGVFPDPPLLIGDVVALVDGAVVVEEPGGGRSNVRGAASVGDRVFFCNGTIQGPAPNLPIDSIDL